MIRTLLGAKIHGCICTDVDLDYEGSILIDEDWICLLYTSPSPRDATLSRMPSSA